MTQFGHGQSNPTYKVDCVRGVSSSASPLATYVLRKKPPGKILSSAHAVEREYAVQKALGALSSPRVPVPRMATLCEDASVVGTPFYLMSFARGHIFLQPGLESLPSAAHRAAVYDAMADTLGALHRVDPKEAGLEGFGKPDAYSRRQVERWARQYRESVVTPEPFMTELIEWLRAHVPPSEPSGRIVHGDFRLDNLVFANANGPLGDASGGNAPRDARRAETGVVAVLDWELATVGAPYSDVAYCCMPYHLPSVDAANPGMASTAYPAFGASIPDGVPSEKAFVRRWARAAGLPNPTEGASAATRWPFYVAMSLFRGAAILAGVRARGGGERQRGERARRGDAGGNARHACVIGRGVRPGWRPARGGVCWKNVRAACFGILRPRAVGARGGVAAAPSFVHGGARSSRGGGAGGARRV